MFICIITMTIMFIVCPDPRPEETVDFPETGWALPPPSGKSECARRRSRRSRARACANQSEIYEDIRNHR